MAFLAAKSALENASDEKRKIEINSQFKKARARLVCFKILKNTKSFYKRV